MQKEIHIPEVGKVLLKKSKRSRKLYIRIKTLEGIQVTVPSHISFEEAKEVVYQKVPWIQKHLPRIQAMENGRTFFTADTVFRTKDHQLRMLPNPKKDWHYQLHEGELRIYYPPQVDWKKEENQSIIRNIIEKTWRSEAKRHLPSRLDNFAQMHQFSYKSVRIKNTLSRWGSCSSTNAINLSLHLMRLPDELVDYVLLHELCHTIQKNHGPDFWALLNKVCPQARQLDRQLSAYSPKIY